MKFYKQAILPSGFKASGVNAGIKKSGKLDLALFYSQYPAKAAGLFTTNTVVAAPVVVSKIHLKTNKRFYALIANSGNANMSAGSGSFLSAGTSTYLVAQALGVKKRSVLVASTGIIGKPLPLKKIKNAIPELIAKLSKQGIREAKNAILTTDKFPKEITAKFLLAGKMITICGIAKGAGMIAPDMATMLVFVFTDANIAQAVLNRALKEAVAESFNSITVDGCMSTNDSVILFANGCAGNKLIAGEKNLKPFVIALKNVCLALAKDIVRDAEGGTKFISIKVRGAKNRAEAKKIALYIANSPLVKTAIYGENPNFGRILAAIGASKTGTHIKAIKKIEVSPLHRKDIKIDVKLSLGKAEATVYTSDLTPEYIKINAEYN